MTFLPTPETLATLSHAELYREVHRLRQLGYELDRQLFEMFSLLEYSLDSKVKRLLPRLTRAVRCALAQVHPDFLTPERLTLFQQHQPLLGLWPRAGHSQALAQLRAEFRAHLTAEREKAGESELLDDLARQKGQLKQALQWTQDALRHCEAQTLEPSETPNQVSRGGLPAFLANCQGPLA